MRSLLSTLGVVTVAVPVRVKLSGVVTTVGTGTTVTTAVRTPVQLVGFNTSQ